MKTSMSRSFARVLVFGLVATAFLPHSALAQIKGNGLPGGQKLLFNLEVIAYDPYNCPQGDFTGSNTHRIQSNSRCTTRHNGEPPAWTGARAAPVSFPGPLRALVAASVANHNL